MVVYSTDKRIDFATSLRLGPHSGTQLAALIDSLRLDPSPGDVEVETHAVPAGGRSTERFRGESGVSRR